MRNESNTAIRLPKPAGTVVEFPSSAAKEQDSGMDIYLLVREFYAIEAIYALVAVNETHAFDPMRHSHNRWVKDFDAFREEYIAQFASAIFDYTVLVVAAELRNCEKWASQYIGGYYSEDISRTSVFHDCTGYRPQDILAAGVRMFDTDRVLWNRNFGGEKWRQIAKAGLLKDKISDCAFIDHCVDLSHNHSIYFDKGAGIFRLGWYPSYQQFLDTKRTCEPHALLYEKLGCGFNRLQWRANNLGIVDFRAADNSETGTQCDKAESLLLAYTALKWGDMPLDYSERNIVGQPFSAERGRVMGYDYDDEYARCA